MQGIRAFESASEFRFYVGVVSTTDMYLPHLYLAGLDESAGISVFSQLLVISKFSTPNIAFLSFRLAKKLRL